MPFEQKLQSLFQILKNAKDQFKLQTKTFRSGFKFEFWRENASAQLLLN
jgi:hypothetical protein